MRWHTLAIEARSDAGAGEGVTFFAEDDEAAVAGDVGFHHVLWVGRCC